MDTYDIFVSYRTTHGAWVETLATNLKEQGLRVFFDKWELIPGASWTQTRHEISVDAKKLERSLARLELAYVLGRENGKYVYRVPLFRDMVLRDDPEVQLRMEIRSLPIGRIS